MDHRLTNYGPNNGVKREKIYGPSTDQLWTQQWCENGKKSMDHRLTNYGPNNGVKHEKIHRLSTDNHRPKTGVIQKKTIDPVCPPPICPLTSVL